MATISINDLGTTKESLSETIFATDNIATLTPTIAKATNIDLNENLLTKANKYHLKKIT